MAFDVRQNERVVAKQTPRTWRIPGAQRIAARLRGLDVVGVAPLLVTSFSNNGVDFEPVVRGQRALEEAVLEAGRAFDEQNPARARRPLDSTLRALFSGTSSPGATSVSTV